MELPRDSQEMPNSVYTPTSLGDAPHSDPVNVVEAPNLEVEKGDLPREDELRATPIEAGERRRQSTRASGSGRAAPTRNSNDSILIPSKLKNPMIETLLERYDVPNGYG
ncbi:hypothetical protein GH714_032532 [Hevea brasiliensis]|uniref:Uncharacterized protein n=1 Tax=Hevea brasiliensis TaxID=3981 RepID=A0A6A6K837_HEVBR|nr:hypothetical protein GH714_032483 [Hevea brasiliensis]KAF2284918.1 hypothetical protein GH714_032532 [Hevea brasiliensis]